MTNWKAIAKKALGGGSATTGLDKITVDEIIAQYPDGITLTGANIVKMGDVTFPVFTFTEEPKRYFSGGKALREMVDAWLEASDGDLREVNDWLKANPMKIRMSKVRTKSGNMFTQVETVDDEPTCDPDTGEVVAEPF